MTVSNVLRPSDTDYDTFLFAEVGEDREGAAVTVLSALASLGVEPRTEAKDLADLGREEAEFRLNAHLAAITDVPALALASESRAAKLVSLLPRRAPPTSANAGQTSTISFPQVSLFWSVLALVGGVVVAWIFYLAQMG